MGAGGGLAARDRQSREFREAGRWGTSRSTALRDFTHDRPATLGVDENMPLFYYWPGGPAWVMKPSRFRAGAGKESEPFAGWSGTVIWFAAGALVHAGAEAVRWGGLAPYRAACGRPDMRDGREGGVRSWSARRACSSRLLRGERRAEGELARDDIGPTGGGRLVRGGGSADEHSRWRRGFVSRRGCIDYQTYTADGGVQGDMEKGPTSCCRGHTSRRMVRRWGGRKDGARAGTLDRAAVKLLEERGVFGWFGGRGDRGCSKRRFGKEKRAAASCLGSRKPSPVRRPRSGGCLC